jgi:hypothetical protein
MGGQKNDPDCANDVAREDKARITQEAEGRDGGMMRLLRAAAPLAVISTLLIVAACSPKLATGDSGGAQETAPGDVAVTVAWSVNSDCGICHSLEAHSFEDAAAAASLHGSKQCVDCHDDIDALDKIHEGTAVGDFAPKRLKKTVVDKDICLSCHKQANLANVTSDSLVLTDMAGKVVNPHELPATASGIHGEIVCADCHELHNDSSGLDKNSKDYCLSCHHADVFECNTCHAER